MKRFIPILKIGRVYCFLALFCLLFGPASRADAAVAELRLSRDTFMVGEVVAMEVAVDGATPQYQPQVPRLVGLNISYTGNGQKMEYKNGQTSFTISFNYNLSASQPGAFIIPAISVRTDKGVLKTEPVTVTVQKSDLPNESKQAFLKLVVPKTEIYVGELIPIEIQLYVTQGESLEAPQLKNDGFVIGKQAPHVKTQTQIGRDIYTVFSFKMTVAAAKAGQLALGPAETRLTLLIPLPRANDMFNDFFNRFERRPVELKSDVIPINVLPLPLAGAPADFSGAIGKFSFTSEAGPKTLTVGDPITLKIAVRGEGTIESLKLPEIKWRDFKAYDPNSVFTPAHPLSIQGTKSFEQVVIPENADVKELPPLSFSYFDPDAKAYRTITQPAVPLEVKASASTALVPPANIKGSKLPEAPEPARDLIHIKSDPGHLAMIAPPLIQQPWFLALQSAPVLALLACLTLRKRKENLANNPRLLRKIETQKNLRRLKAELSVAADKGAEEFYVIAFRLLQESLGGKLFLPASGITETVLDDHLSKLGAPPALILELHQIFQLCHQARYSSRHSPGDLKSFETRLKTALDKVETLPDK